LWRRGLRWRVGLPWYALVLVGPGVTYGVALGVAGRLGVPLPAMDFSVLVIVSAVVSGLLAGLSEEFGWSGFAFPAVQARYGFIWAGIVVGLAVGLWHLPFFFVPGLPHFSAWFGLFMLAAIPLRMLFGWIFNGSGGSVLLMILFHASWNTWAELLSPPLAVPEPAWLAFTALLWLAAVVILSAKRWVDGQDRKVRAAPVGSAPAG
jgi:membrane protease YdiL (CAAX protease family)